MDAEEALDFVYDLINPAADFIDNPIDLVVDTLPKAFDEEVTNLGKDLGRGLNLEAVLESLNEAVDEFTHIAPEIVPALDNAVP